MIDDRNRPTPETFTLPDRLLTEKEAAAMLSLSPATLRRWRSTGEPRQPEFCRIGRAIRYKRSECLAWIGALETGGGVR